MRHPLQLLLSITDFHLLNQGGKLTVAADEASENNGEMETRTRLLRGHLWI